MGKICIRFQAKTAQKTRPFGAAYTYMANIREYPTVVPVQVTDVSNHNFCLIKKKRREIFSQSQW